MTRRDAVVSVGLARLDRVARRGALFQPPPLRRQRFRFLRWLGTLILMSIAMAAIVALGAIL